MIRFRVKNSHSLAGVAGVVGTSFNTTSLHVVRGVV